MTTMPAPDDRRPAGAARPRLAGVFADIAALTQVLRLQTEMVAAETERWSIGLIETLQSVEPRLAAMRDVAGSEGPLPLAAIEHCGAIEDAIEGTCAMVQVQDIVRQRLQAVTHALDALYAECRDLAEAGTDGVEAGPCPCGALAGSDDGHPSAVARIADRFDAMSVIHRPLDLDIAGDRGSPAGRRR